ncbi:MAG: ABC transporter ATP-binding protein [Desulfomonilaceae bacterium]
MLLTIKNVSKSFGGLRVLTNFSAEIGRKEVVGLIGPNGAGKSTLFNLITGISLPDTGSIRLGQSELVGLSAHRICHLGIARTFQLVKVFPTLTCLENVRLGAEFGPGLWRKRSGLEPGECLEAVGLRNQADTLVGRLTFSDRRRLEVARALATNPHLILLDEPMAGLSDTDTRTMTGVIRRIREETDMAVFWVEHNIEAVFGLSDRLIVLDFGVKIAEGSPTEVAKNATVIDAYLGSGWIERAC